MIRKILYLQFTNPAGYPPLEHGARILADRGWSVTFLGIGAFGDAAGFRIAPHPGIRVRQIPYMRSPALRKLAYIAYCAWAVFESIRLRPLWVYASDPLSCLPALISARLSKARLLYHEHDSPPDAARRGNHALLDRARRRSARTARLCILPNADRAARFVRETGSRRPVVCVWNCPERAEATIERNVSRPRTLLFYHGSLNGDRLPFSVLNALCLLPDRVGLEFAGYATTGTPRYGEEFLAEAERLGLKGRVRYLGPIGTRADLMRSCRKATVGLSLMPKQSADPNMRAMAGASNKPFDYMACGLALLVTDLPEWEAMFVHPGYGLSCDPGNPRSIAEAIARLDNEPGEAATMGERGARRIAEDWNYETQFTPVLAEVERA